MTRNPNRLNPEIVLFRSTKEKKSEFKKYAEAEHGKNKGLTICLNKLMDKYILSQKTKFKNNPHLVID